MGLGVKAFFLQELVRQIHRTASGKERNDYIETFNALMLPKAYVHVDDADLVHIVVIKFTSSINGDDSSTFTLAALPLGVQHHADIIWRFDPATGLWNTLKDRTGDFSSLCPIKCGGIPTVKARQQEG
jgi:hypothetical protein